MSTSIRDARRALVEAGQGALPGGVGEHRRPNFAAQWKPTRSATLNGKTKVVFEGHASVYETNYEMWDMFGEYDEKVATGAGAQSLAAGPDVMFLINHGGVTMARTVAGTLELSEDSVGLADVAFCNPERADVQLLKHAVDDGEMTEQSFAFVIEAGQWSPDYLEYTIVRYDIDRGDVSGVNFGANPFTDVAARSSEIMNSLQYLPAGAAREAIRRLEARAQRSAMDAGATDERIETAGARAVERAATTRTGYGVSQLALMLELERV